LIGHESVSDFLAALARPSATPAAGSVVAIMGAMGAALVDMVCALTISKGAAVGLEAQLQAVAARAQAARARLTALADQDVEAFEAVMRAYALPRDSEPARAARSLAIQAALRSATEVPLVCARACGEVTELSRIVAQQGHVNAAGEAAVAGLAARAALHGAALTVRLNAGSLKD
jgi:methenyltetrahydrofolate cyclohydrolase